MYAIVRTGGKQYRVSEGDAIAVERLDADAGDEVTLADVLLVDDGGETRIGTPTVAGASVTARVEAQERAPKVSVYKYKNKTRRRVLRGHRQPLTRLVITAIRAG
ncbi:MAG: 50S ribosomal protein L21 [Chloroflexi bacterium]|nr:50S ribosomal protein L21 [Chloroflexota bacterium]